jgi:hypothetical protein
LIQNGLRLWSYVELGRVVDEEENVGSINEPLAGIIEGERALNLFPNFQNPWNFYQVDLFRE